MSQHKLLPTSSISTFTRLFLLLLALTVLGAAPAASAESYPVQVFALAGPSCPVASPDIDCPDALLPGARLVLQRRKQGVFRDVLSFRTNRAGYANLWVEGRGMYRIVAAPDDSPIPRPSPLPRFEGPVRFHVPARHFDATGMRTTPVAVHFDSGIR